MAGHAPVHRPHGPSGSRSAQRWPAPALHPAMPPRIVEAFELKAAAVRHDASLPAWLERRRPRRRAPAPAAVDQVRPSPTNRHRHHLPSDILN